MARRPRPLTQHDEASWAAYAQLVRPLPGRTVPVLPPAPAAPATTPPSAPKPAMPRRQAGSTYLTTGLHPPGLDAATWGRFQQGKLAPARVLDLHGKTAQAAYHALERFLHTACADHIRCVEIITGRGSGEAGGVIRRELPLWLNLPTLRPLILAAVHPGRASRAVNDGATRILLRRAR